MEKVALAYGESEVTIEIEGAKSVAYLQAADLDDISDMRMALQAAVTEECIDSPPLNRLIGSEDKVTLVVSDVTRLWQHQDLVIRELVDYLSREIGVPDENMAVLIALGTHRAQTEEENVKVVSKEVMERVAVYSHDAYAEDLVDLGATSRGTRVKVNPLAVGRKVILIGGTVHHLMSGFGGGRKSVVPGISAKETVLGNHLMCLSADEPRSNPEIGVGKLRGNPVNEDMVEAAGMLNPAFSINIVMNSHGKHSRLICGHWLHAWEESCRIVHETCGIPIDYKADVVIASCGGYPKDINFYQGVKTLLNMSLAVKEGGTMVFLAECREGGGPPDFFDWNESLSNGTLDADLRAAFTIAGYIFYAGCESIAKGRTLMLTQIQPDILKDMKIEACNDIEQLMKQVDFSGKDVYIMRSGGNTVPYLAGQDPFQ